MKTRRHEGYEVFNTFEFKQLFFLRELRAFVVNAFCFCSKTNTFAVSPAWERAK